MISPNTDNSFKFFIVERNNETSNREDWNQWQIDIGNGKSDPDHPPKSINVLHARNRDDILNEVVKLSDRILMTCDLSIHTDGENMLKVEYYDGEEGSGIGKDFYLNTLPQIARELNIKFITGLNTDESVGFFVDKIGRYTLSQLKPEAAENLFPEEDMDFSDFVTIQFLDQKDIKKYVSKEFII